MKFIINREKPVTPPVSTVALTLTKGDLLGLLRVLGRAYDADSERPLPVEGLHGVNATKTGGLFEALMAAGREAALVTDKPNPYGFLGADLAKSLKF